MAPQTGRTATAYIRFVLDDKNGQLDEIPVDSINGVGLDTDVEDVSAWQDAIKNTLLALPSCVINVTGPVDNSALAAASASGVKPVLSGSITLLKDIVGKNTPLALGVLFGMRHYYETGEPAFGLNFSAGVSGFLCSKFTVDGNKYSASFVVFGTTAPSWLDALPTS